MAIATKRQQVCRYVDIASGSSMKATSYQLGLLCINRIAELQKGLKLIVLGECDYLHDCAKLGENLQTKQNKQNNFNTYNHWIVCHMTAEQFVTVRGPNCCLPVAVHPASQGRTCCQ